MGLFSFLGKKKGMESSKFNSDNFQKSACALALWKLKENNGDPHEAILELKKIGLNDEQVQLIINRARTFLQTEKKPIPKSSGVSPALFNSHTFQTELVDLAKKVYFESGQNYSSVQQKFIENGLNETQCDIMLKKFDVAKNKMIEDFESDLDSGRISGIKISPNPDHIKGKIDEDQVDKYIGYGAFQLERGDLDNALELFDKALELDDKATLAYANKGTLYAKKGDSDKALEFYNRALEIEPNHIQVLEGKMDLLVEIMNEANEVDFLETVRTILNNDPSHPNALIYIIQSYSKNDDVENALSALKELFKEHFSEGIAIQLLLQVFWKIKDKAEAMTEFAKMSEGLSDNAKYQLNYCKALHLKGLNDFEESIGLFKELNELHLFSWNYYQIAIIKNLQGKEGECLQYLKQTFDLEPELKADAKQFPELQNLWGNEEFLRLTS